MKMMKKRGLALVLALVLALSLLPISAFATEGEAAPTAAPTYQVGDTCTSDTMETSELPTNIPAGTMWAYQGEVKHTHTADCYNDLIVLKDGNIGTFTDSENVSQAHMWKAAGGEWYALDCVPANTDDTDDDHDDTDDDHDDTDDDHDNTDDDDDDDANTDDDDDDDANTDDDDADDNTANTDDDDDDDDDNTANTDDDDTDDTDDDEQPAFTSGEVHHVGSYDGHAAGCYGRRVVPFGDDLPGTIDGVNAIYTFKTTTVANWYARSCDSAPQYSWKLVEFVINQKLIKISYAWAGTPEAIAAVKGVKLPDNDVKEIVINQAAVKPVPTATIDGYEISGWYTEKACMNKYKSYTQLEGKSEITLYAKVAAVVADPEVPVKTHTYKVRYIYMLKDADGKYYPKGRTDFLDATLSGEVLNCAAVWAAADASGERNKVTYYKRGVEYLNEDVADAGFDDEGNQKYTVNLYGEKQAPSTKLTIRMEVKGLGDDKSAYNELIDKLWYTPTHTNGTVTRLESFGYGTGVKSYSSGLEAVEHTLMQENADVDGYTRITTCNDLDNDPKNGYQFNVEAGKNTEITITNTYEKIPEKVYSLIFDAGDNGVMQGAEANEIPETTYFWKSDVEDPYWEKVGGAAVSSKKLIYQFTEENVAAEIALFAGKGSVATSPKTPDITANEGYAFQDFQLNNGTPYDRDNALSKALALMGEATSLTYHATYTGGPVNPPVDPNPPVNPPVDPNPPVNPPVDPNPPVNPPVDPNPPVNPPVDPNPPVETPVLPGGDDGYEPAIPPVTPLPDPEVPLAPLPDELVTDLPQEEIPLAELPEDEVPLAELPEEEVPLAEAPKTGDSFGIWVALLGMSSLAMAALVLGKRKENQEN